MEESKRLFVAIKFKPNELYQDLVNQLRHRLRTDMISWIEPEMAHLTLKFFGQTPVTRIESIESALLKSVQNQAPFEIKIDKVGAFGSSHSPKVIWMGMQDDTLVKKLHFDLINSIRQLGYYPDPGNFIPHITLGRVKKIMDKPWFWDSISLLQNREIQTAVIDKTILYESVLLKKGVKHNVVQEFPFKVC
jgi:2'-5' RNA ligase